MLISLQSESVPVDSHSGGGLDCVLAIVIGQLCGWQFLTEVDQNHERGFLVLNGCPCGEREAIRSRRRGLIEYPISFAVLPYYCQHCSRRFFMLRSRHGDRTGRRVKTQYASNSARASLAGFLVSPIGRF